MRRQRGGVSSELLMSATTCTYPLASCRNSLAYSVRNRECGGPRICTPRSILEGLCSDDSSTYQIYGNDEGSPPFSLKFGRSKRAACLVGADLRPRSGGG
eukprot:768737-Hanusia_phi.AAC.6